MKGKYSTFSNEITRIFKIIGKPRSEQHFNRLIKKMYNIPEIKEDKYAVADLGIDSKAYFLWKYRNMRHFFIDHGLCDFFINAVKDFNEYYRGEFPECGTIDGCFSKNYDDRIFAAQTECNKTLNGFALHFPANEQEHSIIVVPYETVYMPNDVTDTPWLNYWCTYSTRDHRCSLGESMNIDLIRKRGDKETERFAKLIFGFTLYISAFPEQVKCGTTSDIKHISHYKGERVVIGRSEVVGEEEKNSKNPHWRKGHLRLLTHERYKKKRFQAVYVKGAFIKGTAYDVEKDA